MQLPLTVKKTVNCKHLPVTVEKKTVNSTLCFFFTMRNPAIFYKRSDTAIPESNSL